LIVALTGEIFGLPIPDAGSTFATALVIHILCGLTAVITGRSPPPRGNEPDAIRVPAGSICGQSVESSPPQR
jgi:hypothetical protein